MSDFPFGYCTNVHAGSTLPEAQENLLKFATDVRQRVVPNGRLPVGLWLAEPAAAELVEAEATGQFKQWLAEHELLAYTFNGFPQQDFHQTVVKHEVYKPTWLDPRRKQYTLKLAKILNDLLESGQTGSISTLPLGWPNPSWCDDSLQQAAKHLLGVAEELRQIHERTGVEIVLAMEPEPGCVFDKAPEIVDFFTRYLFAEEEESAARQHLSVCHDMCHSAVMWEPQQVALEQYLAAGIRIGKVQVSSAVHVPWDECETEDLQAAIWKQLSAFNEPKYLHQVTRAKEDGSLNAMAEDLDNGLAKWHMPEYRTHPWRVHFHVPIFVNRFENLATTQPDIRAATEFLEEHRRDQVGGSDWFTGHYEVETYAWPVLPKELAVKDLAGGIAQELEFFHELLTQVREEPKK